MTEPSSRPDPAELAQLARALAEVGRGVRDAVLAQQVVTADRLVVRTEGGDDIFGVDDRADRVLVELLGGGLGDHWPGRLIVEGFDDPLAVGDITGPWTYIADPIDGTRPWLAGKRSAWILLGAGLGAVTLEDLQVGAAVELPTIRSRKALVTWATADFVVAEDDDLTGGPTVQVQLRPQNAEILHEVYVTVARARPGSKGRIGDFEDRVLVGLNVYEDSYLSTGGQMMGLATGNEAAVIDARPLLGAAAAHPYDLAALVVARASGVIIEALPPGPLNFRLDTVTEVAWAGYANEGVARLLRARWDAATAVRSVALGEPAVDKKS